MQEIRNTTALREVIAGWRERRQRIVLVPTMGHLHDGHLSLVNLARKLGDKIVVTIFVNPLQFGAAEDFGGYIRNLDDDAAKLRQADVDLLFAPDDTEIYPHGHDKVTWVEVPELSNILCGKFRPGHFRGVATVVTKLFNLIQPDAAVFGEKDYQQLLVIRSLVADLNFPIEIIAAPTVREQDGLAMSSRNCYLSPAERKLAPALYATLCAARDEILNGSEDYVSIERMALESLRKAGFTPDYFAVRRADDLGVPAAGDKKLAILVAAWLGKARLIDNLHVTSPSGG